MEFNPDNRIVQLSLQGMRAEDAGNTEEAAVIFHQSWTEAGNDFEKFLAAYFIARHQKEPAEKLHWLQIELEYALKVNDDSVKECFVNLYTSIAKCYQQLGDITSSNKNLELAEGYKGNPSDKGPFYHGTRADLKIGDELIAGFNSNYQSDLTMNHIYFTAIANGAGLAAALAKGEGAERVYIVEPVAGFENDPNVTDKKFPGNPTRSYRTTEPLKIVGELKDWVRQTPEQIQRWKDRLAKNNGEIIN